MRDLTLGTIGFAECNCNIVQQSSSEIAGMDDEEMGIKEGDRIEVCHQCWGIVQLLQKKEAD